MAGPRRYGTTKVAKAPGSRASTAGPAAAASAAEPRRIPLLTGERREIRVPNDGNNNNEQPYSERQPLLMRSGSDHKAAGGGRGGRGSGGNGDAAPAVFAAGSSRRDNTKVLTTLLVLNYMIGSGILNAPQVFQGSGIGSATILYIVAALATWLGIVVLIDASELTFPRGYTRGGGNSSSSVGSTGGGGGGVELLAHAGHGDEEGRDRSGDVEFAHLARETLGPRGALYVDVSVVLQNLGDICSYVILVGSLTVSLLDEWVGDSASGAWWASFSVVTPVMVAVFVFPVCLIRHFSNLRWLALFSFGAISSVVLLVVIGGPIYSAEERSESVHNTDLDSSVTWWDWSGSIAKMGSIVFALSCSPAVLHAYTALTPRSSRAWRSVAGWAVGIGGFMCYVMGLAGYLSFRDAVDGDILENFSGAVASVFKAVVVVHLILYIPSEVIVLRHSLFALRNHDVMAAEFGKVAWVTFALLALVVAFMVGLDAAGVAQGDLFGYILDIAGGVTGSALSFILPALIYLSSTRDEEQRFLLGGGGGDGGGGGGGGGWGGWRLHGTARYRLACKGLVVFGAVVMVVVPIGVAIDIATS